MSAHVARKHFSRNLERLDDPERDAEKIDLYRGLAALAEAVEDVRARLHRIDQRLRDVEKRLPPAPVEPRDDA